MAKNARPCCQLDLQVKRCSSCGSWNSKFNTTALHGWNQSKRLHRRAIRDSLQDRTGSVTRSQQGQGRDQEEGDEGNHQALLQESMEESEAWSERMGPTTSIDGIASATGSEPGCTKRTSRRSEERLDLSDDFGVDPTRICGRLSSDGLGKGSCERLPQLAPPPTESPR